MDGDEDSVTAAAAPKQATLTTRSGFPKPITEMTAEEKARVDNIDLRCLSLCIGMLERVNGVGVASFSLSTLVELIGWQTFEENSTLEGILADLIIPAVKRKELALREKGLVSLGLCCLIARVCLFLPSDLAQNANSKSS